MNLLDEIQTGPMTRWRKHGQVPLRCLSHAVVVLFLIVHIFSLNTHLAAYSLGVTQTSTHWFQDSIPRHVNLGFHYDQEDFRENRYEFLNTTASREFFLNFMDFYYAMNTSANDILLTDKRLPQVQYTRRRGFANATERDSLSYHSFTFTEDEWRTTLSTMLLKDDFFRTLLNLRLSLWVEGMNVKQRVLLGDACVRWHFILRLTHTIPARILAELRQEDARTCTDDEQINRSTVLVLLTSLILVAIVHAGFGMLRVRKGMRVLRIVRRLYEEDSSAVNAGMLPFREKLTIVNVWVIMSMLGDLLIVGYAMMQLNALFEIAPSFDVLDTSVVSDIAIVVLGLGTIAHLLGLLEYAQYGFKSYLFLQVCEVARRDVIPSLFLLLPLMMGYAVFGLCMFGDHVDRFSTLGMAITTLFSVSFGDEIWVTIRAIVEVDDLPSVVAVVYIISFIFTFNYIFAMSILATVEEVYMTEGHWLYTAKPAQRNDGEEPSARRRRSFVRSRSLPPRPRTTPRLSYQRSGVSLNVSQRTAQYLMSRSFDESKSTVD